LPTLTTAQLQALKADVAADAVLGPLPRTEDNAQRIADAYNQPAAPAYTVWKTDLNTDDINNAVDWTEVTALTTNPLLAFQALKTQSRIDGSRASIRNAFNQIFKAASAPNSNAGLLAAAKRPATRFEKLFATGTGSTASPGTMAVEGALDRQTVVNAWNS
jgi:hypothetical protein